MSANETGVVAINDSYNQASFACDIPIPSYLIAIAIGDIEYRSLGRRVGVITEPSQMDKVATELEDMGDLLDAVPHLWVPDGFDQGCQEGADWTNNKL